MIAPHLHALLRSTAPLLLALAAAGPTAICLVAAPAAAATLEEGLALKRQEKLAEAAAVFAELVRARPGDAAALEQLATVQGWLGQHDEAIATWSRLIALAPKEPSFQLGRARVRYWKGALAQARAELELILQGAPKDLDALLLAGDVALAQGDRDGARDRYQRAQEHAPGDAAIAGKLARTQAAPRFRLDLGGELDGFGDYDAAHPSSRGLEGGWFLQLGARISDDLTVGAGVEELRWFGQRDRRLNLVVDLRLSPDLLLSARGAFTPSHHFLAAWEAGAGAELRVSGPWTALFAAKHLSYADNEVTLLQPGARFESGPFSAQGQAVVALASQGDPTGAGILRLGWAFGDELSTWLGGSYGKEALSTTTGTSFALVGAAFTGVSWALSPGFGLRLDLGYERRQDAHQKYSGALGLTFKI